ncbi:tyrosine-type recombinase/integrase [Proteinivorax hydrogeniformans]|uniref:Tyrosine-type recombinase/integrase n=1 Tax=Proteinivorax hydrogeniformans TaxID=1826727 RepID=A0AAU8HRB3_9FIRM
MEKSCEIIPNYTERNLEVLNLFIRKLKLDDKGELTIKKYKACLGRFLSDLSVPLEKLRPEHVRIWLSINYDDKKAATFHSVFWILSSFFKFCLAKGFVDRRLIKKRWLPPTEDRIIKYLTRSELAAINYHAEKLPLRERVIVEFLLSSGCRQFEAQNLNRKDIDIKNTSAIIEGKGDKTRTVFFSTKCALLLQEYLNSRTDDEEALFINIYGKRASKYIYFKVVRNLGKSASLDKSISPHTLRHTYATHMLAKGKSINFISKQLGHEDLNTTRVYAKILTDDVIDEYNRAMGW